MKEYNIIGDIAGNYKTLLKLLDKMPSNGTPLSVGDMVDRGPRSKEVLEFLMKNGEAVLGNHDHMMLDNLRLLHVPDHSLRYGGAVWLRNGGGSTIRSFLGLSPEDHILDKIDTWAESVPTEIYDWLEALPLYKELSPNKDGLNGFVSHAPRRPDWALELCCDLECEDRIRMFSDPIEETLIWYRGNTKRIQDTYQIFGHNSHWGLSKETDKAGEYGICLDTSRSNVLTGLHWPSMEIFQVDNVDDEKL